MLGWLIGGIVALVAVASAAGEKRVAEVWRREASTESSGWRTDVWRTHAQWKTGEGEAQARPVLQGIADGLTDAAPAVAAIPKVGPIVAGVLGVVAGILSSIKKRDKWKTVEAPGKWIIIDTAPEGTAWAVNVSVFRQCPAHDNACPVRDVEGRDWYGAAATWRWAGQRSGDGGLPQLPTELATADSPEARYYQTGDDPGGDRRWLPPPGPTEPLAVVADIEGGQQQLTVYLPPRGAPGEKRWTMWHVTWRLE